MERDSIASLWRTVVFSLCRLLRVKGHGISIIVPLHCDNPNGPRAQNWRWLREYWRSHLPGAEIIIGCDRDAVAIPFSKSVAVNDAAGRALGDVFVIVDADVFISADAVLHCADEIRHAERKGRPLWFIPYRRLYRLTERASAKQLSVNPRKADAAAPSVMDYSNSQEFVNGTSHIGHWYGAMIQIVSRKAFYTVGGWDTRFRGWGGEDSSAMSSVDTLYGPHKTLPGFILHIWHPMTLAKSDAKSRSRLWANQQDGATNGQLSLRYYRARRHPIAMRQLANEWQGLAPLSNQRIECYFPAIASS